MADPEVEVGGAAPKRRTFRKFAFRGVDLDQLLDMGTDELVKIFTARARRRFQRGLKRKPMALIKKLRKAGRLSVSDIINFSNSEISSRPEGILRSWESSTSLVNVLKNEGKCQFDAGQLSFRGKQVLELSCGHVLPGIFACLKCVGVSVGGGGGGINSLL